MALDVVGGIMCITVVGRRRARGLQGLGDDASGSDSDTGLAQEMEAPHAERFTPRPVDQGRKEFYQRHAPGNSREAEGGALGARDAAARAAAADDIPDVEVDEGGAGGGPLQTPVKDAEAEKGDARKVGAGKGDVIKMLQTSNKGKSSGQVLQQGRPEALQLVKYDRRLANYFSAVGAGARVQRRPRNAVFLAYEAATDMGDAMSCHVYLKLLVSSPALPFDASSCACSRETGWSRTSLAVFALTDPCSPTLQA